MPKVIYWDRGIAHRGYNELRFKHMWPWVFIRLLYISFFYDEMVITDKDKLW